MEGIIKFLEQYWGVTLIGSVTFGTIATFVVVQILTWVKGKTKDKNILSIVDKMEMLTLKYNEEHTQKQLLQAESDAERQQAEQVNAVNFKVLAYLVAASKLPEDAKLQLQSDILGVVNNTVDKVKQETSKIIDDTKVLIVDPLPDKATDIIETAGEQIVSIFDALTKKE